MVKDNTKVVHSKTKSFNTTKHGRTERFKIPSLTEHWSDEIVSILPDNRKDNKSKSGRQPTVPLHV